MCFYFLLPGLIFFFVFISGLISDLIVLLYFVYLWLWLVVVLSVSLSCPTVFLFAI